MALSNSQYEEIMRRYDFLRQRETRIRLERTAEIYSKIPEIKELSDKKIDLFISSSGSENEIKEIDKRIRSLLNENGYPDDYLEMHYQCPICEDTGYVNGEKCRCFLKAEIDLLYDRYELSSYLEKENFDNFRFDLYSDEPEDSSPSPRENAKKAYDEAKAFIDKIGTENNNLLICGKTGSGKSFLSHCIAKEAIEKAYSTVYFSSQKLFDALADHTFGRSGANDTDFIEKCDLLIIDDLGTELSNNFTSSQLFQIINSRAIRKRSTIISTNLSIKELQDVYSERVFSRIAGTYKVIRLTGNDIRLFKILQEN